MSVLWPGTPLPLRPPLRRYPAVTLQKGADIEPVDPFVLHNQDPGRLRKECIGGFPIRLTLIRTRFLERENYRESASLTVTTHQTDPAVHDFREFFDHRQSDTGTIHSPTVTVQALVEEIKHRLLLTFRNTDACVSTEMTRFPSSSTASIRTCPRSVYFTALIRRFAII
jgi:hypothetical protein